MIIGTAGHIDHGKTTLVKSLTGVDCDRLKEEKARGITLDLGYAYLPCPNDAGDDSNTTIGFIDVPGHERLVHNMLAGCTGIDFALLVIAADDGPMPQTREHLEIIDLLGIRQGAVALTKTDLVDTARCAAAQREIEALLAASTLAGSPVFPVSACAGSPGTAQENGIAALRAHLFTAARRQQRRAAGGHFRLAIDRAFSLNGVGTVVTGTAASGVVRTGDTLLISPTGQSVRVRSLRVADQPASQGSAGERLALALVGIEKNEISRGMWVLAPRLHLPQDRFAARLRVLAWQNELAHWTPVHIHLGADDIPGRLALLEADNIAPGAMGLAEIKLARPISVVAGDRFIVRDAAARRTLAGGVVLDIFPPARHKRRPERLALLRAQASADTAAALLLAAEQQPAGVDLARFALNRNLDEQQAQALITASALHRVGDTGLSPAHWQTLGARLRQALADEHARSPDMPGVEHDRLRRLTLPSLPRAVFNALLDEARSSGQVCDTGAWLHLPEHRIQLAASDQNLWQQLAPLLDTAPYNPPRVRDLAKITGVAEDHVRTALKRLARAGEVYPVAHDHFFSAASVDNLARRIAALCAREGAAFAAHLRDEIGGGRKVAIQILEFFDRIGYTRRVRDSHVLRQMINEVVKEPRASLFVSSTPPQSASGVNTLTLNHTEHP